MDPLNPLPPHLTIADEPLHGGQAWSIRLRRHTALRITALADGACCPLMAWSAEQPNERWNMPDTLKEQYAAYLAAPRVLMTDMGRVLLAMTADTCGWHDCLCAPSDAEQVRARHGERSYQTHRNARLRNGRDNLLVEMMKHGLSERDWGSTLNLFAKVAVAADGALAFQAGHARRGQYVDLRAEMDAIVALTALPHALDPATAWEPRPLHLTVWRCGAPAADDPCRVHRPETRRAYARTEAQFP